MRESIVSLKQVNYKYKHLDNFVLRNISLEIQENDFVLLVGYSGSGKSTLLKCINGLIPNFYPGSFGGIVTVSSHNTLEVETAHLAEIVGFVFQNPENQLSAVTVEREIAFPMENFGYSKKKMKERVDRLLSLLKIEHLRKKSPFEISGGEQQLVAIAAALALDPPILVLDEITANISPRSARRILKLIEQLHKEHNKTIILSEHKTDYCIHLINKLIYLEAGEIIVQGKPEEVLLNKSFPRELYPKIPALYTKLNRVLEDNQKIPLPKDILPITIEQLVTILGIQEEEI